MLPFALNLIEILSSTFEPNVFFFSLCSGKQQKRRAAEMSLLLCSVGADEPSTRLISFIIWRSKNVSLKLLYWLSFNLLYKVVSQKFECQRCCCRDSGQLDIQTSLHWGVVLWGREESHQPASVRKTVDFMTKTQIFGAEFTMHASFNPCAKTASCENLSLSDWTVSFFRNIRSKLAAGSQFCSIRGCVTWWPSASQSSPFDLSTEECLLNQYTYTLTPHSAPTHFCEGHRRTFWSRKQRAASNQPGLLSRISFWRLLLHWL